MFSTFNNNQNQGTGLFGANQNKTGSSLFQPLSGPNQQPQPVAQSAFGQPSTQGTGFFGNTGQQPNNQGGLFGTNPPNQVFGASQPNSFQNTPSFGGNQGGLFGNTQTQQQPIVGGNLFGGQNNQGGIFGNTNQQQGGGLFGQNPQNTFGQQNPTQTNQSQGLFGQPQPNTNQGGGLFGANTQQNNTSGGLFGAASNTANTSFLGSQPQPNNTFGSSNMFGANTNQGGTGLFGNTANQPNAFGGNQGSSLFGASQPQQPQPSNQGGLFNSFAPAANNQNTNSIFGGGNTNTNFNSSFNTNSANAGFNANANKFGGTSWGVPTPAQQNTQPTGAALQPVRSKNSKLDQKHLVKCIVALDQFQGCCKEEARISYVQSGGQQPSINQVGSAGFAKPVNNGPLSSLPSFGGAGNNNSLLGGGQSQGSSLFSKPATTFGAPSGQSSLFGASSSNPTPNNSLFGQPSQPSNFGQGTSLFGGASNPIPQNNSLFGAQPAGQQQGGSLFGATTPQTTFFGQTNSQPQAPQQNTSLFGQPAQQGSLFGTGPSPQPMAPSLFGPTAPLQAPPSLFNPAMPSPAPMAGTSAPSLFSPAQPPSFGPPSSGFAQPPPNYSPFAQMMAPLFQQPPQQMDPSMQLLLPQLLLSYALAQPQNQQASPSDPNSNPTLDLITKLVTNMNLSKANESSNLSKNINSLLNPTPFDQFLKEQNNSKWSEKQPEKHSLFSEAEIRQFQQLDSRSYMDRTYPSQIKEDNYQLKHTYKPTVKKADPLGQGNFKVVSRSYKFAQEQAKKKYTPTQQELPILGNFYISPSLDKIKNMTVNQLKKVEKVKISNGFGAIEFLEPISLYKLDLPKSIKIAQDNIQIVDPELQQKKVRMTFANFGNYTNLKPQQKGKLLKKMRKWIEQFDMNQISHDTDNGQLVVETLD